MPIFKVILSDIFKEVKLVQALRAGFLVLGAWLLALGTMVMAQVKANKSYPAVKPDHY